MTTVDQVCYYSAGVLTVVGGLVFVWSVVRDLQRGRVS